MSTTVALEYQITGSADTSAIREASAASKSLEAAAQRTKEIAATSPALRGIGIEAKSAATAVSEMNKKLSEGFGSKLATQFLARFTSPEFLTGLAVAAGVIAKTLIDKVADQAIALGKSQNTSVTTASTNLESARTQLNSATTPEARNDARAAAAIRATQTLQEADLQGVTSDAGQQLLRIARSYQLLAATTDETLDALAATKQAAEDRLADEARTAKLSEDLNRLDEQRIEQLASLRQAKIQVKLSSSDPATKIEGIREQLANADAKLAKDQLDAVTKAKEAGNTTTATSLAEGFAAAREALNIAAQAEINSLSAQIEKTKLDNENESAAARIKFRQDNTPKSPLQSVDLPRTSDALTRIGANIGGTTTAANHAATTAQNTARTVDLLQAMLNRPIPAGPAPLSAFDE